MTASGRLDHGARYNYAFSYCDYNPLHEVRYCYYMCRLLASFPKSEINASSIYFSMTLDPIEGSGFKGHAIKMLEVCRRPGYAASSCNDCHTIISRSVSVPWGSN